MEPLKRRWRNLSLRKTLVVYISAATLLALALCAVTEKLCEHMVKELYLSYPEAGENYYYLTNERGERLGDGTFIAKEPDTAVHRGSANCRYAGGSAGHHNTALFRLVRLSGGFAVLPE